MADRAFRTPQTSGLNFVSFPLTLIGGGSGKAPTLGEGDLFGTFFSQPVFTSTGIFTLTTQDGYPGLVACTLGVMQATAAGTDTVVLGPIPAQNSNGTWTFTFNNFVSGSASDLLAGDRLYLNIVMRNSGSTQG